MAVTAAEIIPENRGRAKGISIHPAGDMTWTSVGKDGLDQKAVRADGQKGHFLGLIRFMPEVGSGLHQHLGVASSYFLAGSLMDYQGTAREGDMGINLPGATHDAVSWDGCILASRLEGPTIYPHADGKIHGLHTGAFEGEIVVRNPEVLPDLNVRVDAVRPIATAVQGVTRRMLYDYRDVDDDHRLVSLNLMPGTQIPVHRTTALVDWYVAGGVVEFADGRRAGAGSFVVLEPDAEVVAGSRYGAWLFAWADGAPVWHDRDGPDLYGFAGAGMPPEAG